MSKQSLRQWHAYLGLFMAPSVLFFALTGAVQVFSLHESHGDYRPPAIIEKLSSVHKDQVFAMGDHHGPPAPEGSAGKADVGATPPAGADDQGDKHGDDHGDKAGDHDDNKSGPATLLLKGFFLLVALCLALSSALGLWIGLTQLRQQRTAWSVVVAGALIPVVLLLW